MVEVEYRDIPGRVGYRVGTDGSVGCRRNRGGWGLDEEWRLLKQARQGKYSVVSIDGAAQKVHTLVLTTFVGPRPEGQQCRHLDDDQRNNCLANLKWGTPLENANDRDLNGKTARGERSNRKLLADEVKTIALYRGLLSQKTLARIFGVSRQTIWHIETGRTWSFT